MTITAAEKERAEVEAEAQRADGDADTADQNVRAYEFPAGN